MKLAHRFLPDHVIATGLVIVCLALAACGSSSSAERPRTLSDLLGQPSRQTSAQPTKTELTPESLVRMGARLEGNGDYNGAMRFYSQAAQLEPNNIDALTGIGNVYLASGFWNAGLNAFRQVRLLNPRSPRTATDLATALLLNDRPGEARQVLNQQIAMTGSGLGLQNLLGLAEDLNGNHVAAQSAYASALRISPGDGEVLTNMALSMALAGSFERAEAILRRGEGTPDAIPLAGQNLALVYALDGQLLQAMEAAGRELPSGQVAANAPFYERLPSLPTNQKARAVFFGVLPEETETPVQPAQKETPPPASPKIETQPIETEVVEPKTAPEVQLPIQTEPEPAPAPSDPEPKEPAPELEPEPELEPAPKAVEPEAIEAIVPEPQTQAPEIADPEPTEPEVTEPPAKEPEPAEPKTALPTATDPEAVDPETVLPVEIEPEVAEPTAPETVTPEPQAKQPTAPETVTPEPAVVESEIAEPEAVEPAATEPEITQPEPSQPAVAGPEADLEPGPYWVQLGSYRYAAQIRAGWATLNRRHGPALEEVEPYAQRHDGGERGMFWRLLTSPATDRAIAQGDCELLLYAGMECFVIRTTGNIQPLSSDLQD